MTEREQMLQVLEKAHERLIAVAMAASSRGVKGPWGPREILAYIVGWEVVAIECLPQLLPGEAPAPLTYDILNLAMATLIGDQPLSAFRDKLNQVHQRFLGKPEVQEEASFVPGHPIYQWVKVAIGHSLEHAEALEQM